MTAYLTLAKWSVEDYHAMIEAGILVDRRVELLDGDIVEMSPKSPLHRSSGEGLANFLRRRLEGRAWVREVGPVTLETSEPEPDIAVVLSPRSRYRDHHPNPSEIYWILEISDSTLNKNLTEKRRIYARAGIAEYWVIAIRKRELYLFRQPVDGDSSVREVYTSGTVSAIAFPDLEISLDALWLGEIF